MAATTTFKLSLLLSLLCVSLGAIPPSCKHFECPSYDVIQSGNDYEIRRYNSTVWISDSPIKSISIVGATLTGFQRLFDYIKGKNKNNETIEMTAPVLTEVIPSNIDGPFQQSTYVVSFHVPKKNQANPPLADGLTVQRWKTVYAAVRQFGGYVNDLSLGNEVSALKTSIAGTKWSAAIGKSNNYSVAVYNAPFEILNRVNEIWLLFDKEN